MNLKKQEIYYDLNQKNEDLYLAEIEELREKIGEEKNRH